MLEKKSKKIIFIAVVFMTWIIFSVWYIANDQWQDFQERKVQQAYELGKNDTINNLITEAAKCQPVSVSSNSTKIEVIAVSCLQTTNTEE